jgi:transcriptional repressor NrdR
VVDSREARGGDEIRRRRVCDPTEEGCGRRFTTFERLERRMPVVIKRSGGRVPYEREKVRNGLLRATWKRPVEEQAIEDFLSDLEVQLSDRFDREVTTTEIGNEVQDFLKAFDQVAFVRFTSVYGDFQSIDEFQHLLDKLDDGEK